jgi:acyl-CoA-binding protein
MSFTPSLDIDEAASYLSSAPSLSKVSTTIKLEVNIVLLAFIHSLTCSQLYGLFKYLKVAPKPQGSRPYIFDMTGRAKWDAWKAASDAYENNSHAAAQRYQTIAQELGWKPGVRNDSAGSESSGGGGGMGTSVSLLINPGPDLGEAQTLHGLAIAGDAEKLMAFLRANPAVDINARDEFVRFTGASLCKTQVAVTGLYRPSFGL